MPRTNLSIRALKTQARIKKNAGIRDRIMAVVFHLKRSTYTEIGQRLGRSRAWAMKWIERYKADGIGGLEDRPRSGKPSTLPDSRMDAFKQRIADGALPKDGVAVLRAGDIRRILREEFNAEYSLSGVYALLDRVEFSRVKPRPRHEKNDPEAMRKWKEETFPLFSPKQKRCTPTKRSKSGFRTKHGTVNTDV